MHHLKDNSNPGQQGAGGDYGNKNQDMSAWGPQPMYGNGQNVHVASTAASYASIPIPAYYAASYPYQGYPMNMPDNNGQWNTGAESPVAYVPTTYATAASMVQDSRAYSVDSMCAGGYTSPHLGYTPTNAQADPTLGYYADQQNASLWQGAIPINAAAPANLPKNSPTYEDYNAAVYAASSVQCVPTLEQQMQSMEISKYNNPVRYNTFGNVATNVPTAAYVQQPLQNIEKKTTWASVAKQPAKLPSQQTSGMGKKKAGMPPAPVVPGKYNMDWENKSTSAAASVAQSQQMIPASVLSPQSSIIWGGGGNPASEHYAGGSSFSVPPPNPLASYMPQPNSYNASHLFQQQLMYPPPQYQPLLAGHDYPNVGEFNSTTSTKRFSPQTTAASPPPFPSNYPALPQSTAAKEPVHMQTGPAQPIQSNNVSSSMARMNSSSQLGENSLGRSQQYGDIASPQKNGSSQYCEAALTRANTSQPYGDTAMTRTSSSQQYGETTSIRTNSSSQYEETVSMQKNAFPRYSDTFPARKSATSQYGPSVLDRLCASNSTGMPKRGDTSRVPVSSEPIAKSETAKIETKYQNSKTEVAKTESKYPNLKSEIAKEESKYSNSKSDTNTNSGTEIAKMESKYQNLKSESKYSNSKSDTKQKVTSSPPKSNNIGATNTSKVEKTTSVPSPKESDETETSLGPIEKCVDVVEKCEKLYNPKKLVLPESAEKVRFFVIKSYSEDDVRRSVKYDIWCSSEQGNRRLDEAFNEQKKKNGKVYLLFSINHSKHFCGVAEMVSSVDYNSTSAVWAESKWKGQFRVNWIYIKDVPNGELRHITLENNENQPVTSSRDTQEVPFSKGLDVLRIIHVYKHTSSIFDDLNRCDNTRKLSEERKANERHLAGTSYNNRRTNAKDYGREGSGYSHGGSGYSHGGSGYSQGGSGYSHGGSGYSHGGSGYSQGGSGYSQGGSGYSHGGSGYSSRGRREYNRSGESSWNRGGRSNYGGYRTNAGSLYIPPFDYGLCGIGRGQYNLGGGYSARGGGSAQNRGKYPSHY